MAQAGWLGPKVDGHFVLCWIHCVNQVNSCNGSSMMAPGYLSDDMRRVADTNRGRLRSSSSDLLTV